MLASYEKSLYAAFTVVFCVALGFRLTRSRVRDRSTAPSWTLQARWLRMPRLRFTSGQRF